MKNCLPPTLPMYTISEMYHHTLFTILGLASTGDCQFLLKQPEICGNLVIPGLFFFPWKYFTLYIFPYYDFEKNSIPGLWLLKVPPLHLHTKHEENNFYKICDLTVAILVQIPFFHAFIDSLQNISGSSSIWQAVCLVLGIQFEQILTLDSHTHGEDKQVIT